MKKLFLLLVPFLLFSCKNNKSGGQSESKLDYSIVTTHINWEDVFNQQELDYFVYFYSTTCAHCAAIKQDILSYYLEEKVTMYFVCVDNQGRFGKVSDLTGICKIDDFYIFGTPFYVEIKNNKVYRYYAGATAIREIISK